MAWIDPRYVEHQRKRFLRHDWERYIRPDWERFMRPDWRDPKYWEGGVPPAHLIELAERNARRKPAPLPQDIEAAEQEIERERLALQKSIDALRLELAEAKSELAFRRLLRALATKAYNPNQPRVPKGNPGAGEWTRDGGPGRIRLASSEKPRLGPATIAQIAAETAKRLIEAYRSKNGLRDLFGRNQGTVAVTSVDGVQIFGSNSTSPFYTRTDLIAAKEMRDRLVEKHPGVLDAEELGRRPNDALFHAESNILLRAA
jgi:hypothetical protein